MKSRIAEAAERELVEATQRLTPQERLNAYLRHCRLMMKLHEAGESARKEPKRARRNLEKLVEAAN